MVQHLHPYTNMTTGKTIALTICTSVGKVMSLLFNTLSKIVITFLPRSKCLLIFWLHIIHSNFGDKKKKKRESVTVSIVSPSICHEVMGQGAIVFQMWNCKPSFSLSTFTFIKRLFNSSSFSAIMVVSFAYLRLLIFLTAILIPA